jgi:hypothetical protein
MAVQLCMAQHKHKQLAVNQLDTPPSCPTFAQLSKLSDSWNRTHKYITIDLPNFVEWSANHNCDLPFIQYYSAKISHRCLS